MLSLQALQALLGVKLASMPDPAVDPRSWECAWAGSPGPWLCLVKRAGQLAASDPLKAMMLLARFPGLAPGEHLDVDSDPDEFLCGQCVLSFSTAAGATTHRRKAHPELLNVPALIKSFVGGSACPVCGTNLLSRLRVLHHLRDRHGRQTPCRDTLLLGGFPVQSAEVLAVADEVDRLFRRDCRKAGRHGMAGPPCRLVVPEAVVGLAGAAVLRS